MNRIEFEAGLEKFLPILRRKLNYLHGNGDGGPPVRRFEEEAALDWIVPLLEDAAAQADHRVEPKRSRSTPQPTERERHEDDRPGRPAVARR